MLYTVNQNYSTWEKKILNPCVQIFFLYSDLAVLVFSVVFLSCTRKCSGLGWNTQPYIEKCTTREILYSVRWDIQIQLKVVTSQVCKLAQMCMNMGPQRHLWGEQLSYITRSRRGRQKCHEGGNSIVTVRVLWANKSSRRLNSTNYRCVRRDNN